MGLNIKNEETYQLAAELSKLTGESMTGAVTQALRERIQRVREAGHIPNLFERLMAIAEECAAHIPEAYRSIDHDQLLYDDRGLPRED